MTAPLHAPNTRSGSHGARCLAWIMGAGILWFAFPLRAARAALLLASAGALAVLTAPNPAHGQEATPVKRSGERTTAPDDGALLREFGLDLATLDEATDTGRLWRALRELVLPGRVSEQTQRRILRRVWLVDPDIAGGSRFDSEAH